MAATPLYCSFDATSNLLPFSPRGNLKKDALKYVLAHNESSRRICNNENVKKKRMLAFPRFTANFKFQRGQSRSSFVINENDRMLVAAKLDGVKTYMRMRRVPNHLQVKVIKWFDYLWLTQKCSDEEKAVSCLPGKFPSSYFETPNLFLS